MTTGKVAKLSHYALFRFPAALKFLIQIPLFQNHVFADDQAVRGHLFQRRQHAADVLVGIHKNDDYRELAAGIDQVAGFDALAAEESADGMEGAGGEDVLVVQVIQNGHVQRLPVPLVGFV